MVMLLWRRGDLLPLGPALLTVAYAGVSPNPQRGPSTMDPEEALRPIASELQRGLGHCVYYLSFAGNEAQGTGL